MDTRGNTVYYRKKVLPMFLGVWPRKPFIRKGFHSRTGENVSNMS